MRGNKVEKCINRHKSALLAPVYGPKRAKRAARPIKPGRFWAGTGNRSRDRFPGSMTRSQDWRPFAFSPVPGVGLEPVLQEVAPRGATTRHKSAFFTIGHHASFTRNVGSGPQATPPREYPVTSMAECALRSSVRCRKGLQASQRGLYGLKGPLALLIGHRGLGSTIDPLP